MVRMTVGRRNLLEQLANSRAARDLRRARRQFLRGVVLGIWVLGWMGVVAWLIEHGAPALARWLGWI